MRHKRLHAAIRIGWMLGLGGAALAAGCSGAAQQQDNIDDAKVALGGQRYETVIEDANKVLDEGPNADAYYLRARAEEERPKPDPEIEASDLSKAREDYQAALEQAPPAGLKSAIELGLGNVAFDQEDWGEALGAFSAALPTLDRPEWRGPALFRMGVCQQRLGQFDAADQTFEAVITQFAGTEWADRATSLEGMHVFYVQLGAFAKPQDAQHVLSTASGVGVPLQLMQDQDLTLVRGGPYTTYNAAKLAKAQLAGVNPDAVIVAAR